MKLEEMIQHGGSSWVPPRIVLYGDPKTGKTSTAARAPSPLFLGTDDGRRRLAVDGLPIPSDWEQFKTQLKAVAEAPEDPHRTIVLDTINGIVQLCAEHVCRTQFGGKWNDPRSGFLAWGGSQGWASVSWECEPVLALLDRCIDAGKWVIVVAHAKVETVKNPLEGDFQRYAPDLDRRVWARFSQWADVILRVGYKVVVKDGKAISEGERILNASATVAEEAGCRVGYELPAVLPFDWEAIEAHLGKPEESAIQELHGLLSTLPAKDLAKIEKYLGTNIDNLDRAPANKIRVALDRLKETTNA